MDFLKRHLFLILCGVAAAGGIGLGATGMRAMPKVRADLENAAGVYKNLESLPPVNERMIEAEQKRIDAILDDRAKVVERAKQLYRYQPLVAGVFPNGGPQARIDFRTQYNEAMRALFDSLKAGGPATSADIERMKDKIETERASERQFGADAGDAGPLRTPAEVLTKAGAKQDATARAAIGAAQRIYCYAVNFFEDKPPERVASLEFTPAMKDTSTLQAPELADCWRAQVTYWLQKDVVNAIVALNDEAAESTRAAKADPWVGIMPVKEVISIRTAADYVSPEGDFYTAAQPGGYGAALAPGTAQSVFTGTASGDAYDVLQFTVKLIMDQRDLPSLVQRITNNTFHTLVRASYKAVPANKNMVGKIYGSEPVVNVVLDFETVMLGEVFRQWMPDEVCEKNEIKCPERKPKDEEEEG
jgi:hypothetical protein